MRRKATIVRVTLDELTVSGLKSIARELRVPGFHQMTKSELVDGISSRMHTDLLSSEVIVQVVKLFD